VIFGALKHRLRDLIFTINYSNKRNTFSNITLVRYTKDKQIIRIKNSQKKEKYKISCDCNREEMYVKYKKRRARALTITLKLQQ
jgi:hypothetical protein